MLWLWLAFAAVALWSLYLTLRVKDLEDQVAVWRRQADRPYDPYMLGPEYFARPEWMKTEYNAD